MDQKNEKTSAARRFTRPDGVIVVARPTRRPEWAGGWYGGVDEATYERSAFSCGARYFYDGAIELLGKRLEPDAASPSPFDGEPCPVCTDASCMLCDDNGEV